MQLLLKVHPRNCTVHRYLLWHTTCLTSQCDKGSSQIVLHTLSYLTSLHNTQSQYRSTVDSIPSVITLLAWSAKYSGSLRVITQYPMQDSRASIPGRHPTVKLRWWSVILLLVIIIMVHHHHHYIDLHLYLRTSSLCRS